MRLRLTLLYGTVFIVAGGGLLTITYLLFRHSQSSQTSLAIHGLNFQLPSGALVTAGVAGGTGGQAVQVHGTTKPNTHLKAAPNGDFTAAPPSKLLQQIRKSGQRQLVHLASIANVELSEQQHSDSVSLLEWSGIALGGMALLSVLLGWLLAGRALRPLRAMNSRARQISAENLNERLGYGARGDELGELATTFDDLLARLDSAFEAQRRFVANASHELRTPLTLERTVVEVALADPEMSVASLSKACERVLASTTQQEQMIDALLTLTRSEAGVRGGLEINLGAIVHEALLTRQTTLANIQLTAEIEPTRISADPGLIERMVGNLLDNAIIHNDGPDRWIDVRTSENDGCPTLRIANGGTPIQVEISDLFEPFRRGNGDRIATDNSGLGLGLSIVKAIATAHGALIDARAPHDGGMEIEIRFPAPNPMPPTADINAHLSQPRRRTPPC